jgi:hypothetical protein
MTLFPEVLAPMVLPRAGSPRARLRLGDEVERSTGGEIQSVHIY